MIDPEKFEVAGAGGAMLLTALAVLRSGAVRVRKEDTGAHEPSLREQTAAPSPPDTAVASPQDRRPRILTGEPAAPELRKSGRMRALRLVGGITTLAVGIAVGLVALVRALVELFSRI
jgi:hypothetical protein